MQKNIDTYIKSVCVLSCCMYFFINMYIRLKLYAEFQLNDFNNEHQLVTFDTICTLSSVNLQYIPVRSSFEIIKMADLTLLFVYRHLTCILSPISFLSLFFFFLSSTFQIKIISNQIKSCRLVMFSYQFKEFCCCQVATVIIGCKIIVQCCAIVLC